MTIVWEFKYMNKIRSVIIKYKYWFIVDKVNHFDCKMHPRISYIDILIVYFLGPSALTSLLCILLSLRSIFSRNTMKFIPL